MGLRMLLLSLFLLCITYLSAQEINSKEAFYNIGTKWIDIERDPYKDKTEEISYTIVADTIINDEHWWRVESLNNYFFLQETANHDIIYANSQMNVKRLLYQFKEWHQDDVLYYESLLADGKQDYPVNSMDTVELLDGKKYQRMHLGGENYIIRGIGYIGNFSNMYLYANGTSHVLKAFYKDGKLIYQNVTPTDTLAIDNEAGKLPEVLSIERGERVAFLILKGGVNEDDLKFIRERMPKLKHLCLKEAELDTIPTNAFNGCSLEQIDLPLNLQYINENAFAGSIYYLNNDKLWPYPTNVYITGPFPKTAAYIQGALRISQDNAYCKEVYGRGIYSLDLKTVYRGISDPGMILEEGVEIIESYAFVDSYAYLWELPSSLKQIKKHAFYMLEETMPAGHNHPSPYINLKATTPPILENDAFVIKEHRQLFLCIPEGTLELYKKADKQWSLFYLSETPPTSIISNKGNALSVNSEAGSIHIKALKPIDHIDVLTLSGVAMYSQKIKDYETKFPFSFCGYFILKVMFADGSVDVLKIQTTV